MKRILLIGLVIIALLVGNFVFVRSQTAYKSRLNEAIASVTPAEIKDTVVLGCKVLTLKRRGDYPGVIKYKSVPEIKAFILAQPSAC